MKRTEFNLQQTNSSASSAGSTRLPYLRPEMEAQQVELEGDCLAAASVGAAGGSNPSVGDWGTDPTPSDPGNSGDLSL